MENNYPLFEKKGFLIAITTFLITFILFYGWTAKPLYCLIAALINSGIIWGTWIVIRMCYIASR